MFKFLGDTPVPITCHACGKQLQKKMKWIKKNKILKCKKCGKKIDLSKKDVRRAVKDIAQIIRDYENAVGKLHASTPKKKTRKIPVKQAFRKTSTAASTAESTAN